jgi:hypothetical protein
MTTGRPPARPVPQQAAQATASIGSKLVGDKAAHSTR